MAAMLLLGWVAGKASTPVDDWFLRYRHSPAQWLLVFTDPRVLVVVLAGAVAVALARRQWRLALTMMLCPPIAIAITQVLKWLFDREKGGVLAYPSGHTTALVVVVGMVVLVAGAALWAVIVAATASLLGMLGLSVTYHYFTDTVGALLLGTAIVCIVAQFNLTGVNPACDLDHTPS